MSAEVMSVGPQEIPSIQGSTYGMDVEEVPEYLSEINEDDVTKCLDGVIRLKNSVIGSNRQKSVALRNGVLPRLLELVSNRKTDFRIKRESCIVICSLVKGTKENVENVVEAGTVPALVEVARNGDSELIEHSLRCLTTIFEYDFAPRDIIYKDRNLITYLVNSMKRSRQNKISVATMLGHACLNYEHQTYLAKWNVVPEIAALLANNDLDIQLPAVSALTALAYRNEEVSSEISNAEFDGKKVPEYLSQMLGRSKPPKTQLKVSKCLTYLHRAGALSSNDPKISMKALPALVRMCGREQDTMTRVEAAETLAYLIEVDKELQSIAAISNHLISTLSEYFRFDSDSHKPLTGNSALMAQAAFKAFASLGANDENIRKRIIDTDSLMDKIIATLDNPNINVALSAVRCLHSLSRSVQQLRTTFKDHSVWKPLMKLLQNTDVEILSVTSSTICNLILEFSPSKEPILEAGGVNILCQLTGHSDLGLRINGIWALMNVAFQADRGVKSEILQSLGTDQIFRLLSDKETTVILKTLGLLRNLVSHPHIDEIMASYGKQIMQAVIWILEGDHGVDVKEQALCMLSNVADGYTSKEFIMTNEDVLKKITSYLNHASSKLQTAAVVCVTNLSWQDDDGSLERQARLKELGVQKLLHSMITASDQNLFERVKTALNQFNSN